MPDQETDTAPTTLSAIAPAIQDHYRVEIWLGVKAALGVVCSLSLKNRDHCLVLIFEGTSGQGKSIIVRLLEPDREASKERLERVDDFTSASFVSHASNRTRKELDEIDLLPKIRQKVMMTKELAPVFRGDEKELKKNFSRLTSVLDGDGYQTQSGTQGTRGYVGDYLFNWIGATTPIPERTHKIMSQLGNRLLIYEIMGEETSEEDLMEFATNYEGNNAVSECRKLTNDFIETHFKTHPVESVDPGNVAIPEPLQRELVRYAMLISVGRVEVETRDGGDVEAGSPEGAYRPILLLQMLAKGLAVGDRRTTVEAGDLDIIRHVAFSTLPGKRRGLLRALLTGGGDLTSHEVEQALGVSRPTAIARMRELAATQIVISSEGKPSTSTPSKINLADDWRWLLNATPPLKESGV